LTLLRAFRKLKVTPIVAIGRPANCLGDRDLAEWWTNVKLFRSAVGIRSGPLSFPKSAAPIDPTVPEVSPTVGAEYFNSDFIAYMIGD
jgi:hypothetical protein